ncbi:MULTISPECIES: hypothetical protein [Streptomyces]|nr:MULTISPECIES: hypothetical protein [Streptomyces]MYS98537.1 hypothetical protein [Streptomyces sp. SID5469]BBJ50777.1 hypothetical protein SAVMC3_34060 [Streptomyces avermitilis]GDY62799.1 hypothetical protein SAV14893_021920 [Streptomyces avermitilis]GDY77073.1 hypothetical protein SAV31267_065580 [Streptomyces avermitilis]GDY85987.1 hypothetical protein SAVCW2_51860 [Streptomyces avermitilis]
MTLARSLPDNATEWWIFLGTFVLYVLGRWFFAWQRARREGDSHPMRTAFAEEDDPAASHAAMVGGFRSYRQFFGFVGSAVAVVLVAALTEGWLRHALLWIIVPLLVIALSYLDFRQALKARSEA